jgi:hypothetical protein
MTIKRGGDSLKLPYLFLNSMAYDESFPLSLVETFEEPDVLLDISCLDILWIKLLDHFNQLYGSKDKDTDYKDLVPKFYHKYLQLFSKKASERYPELRPYNHKIHLKPDFKPIQQSPCSLNSQQTDLAKMFVQENLRLHHNLKLTNGFTAIFYRKKDGFHCPCQDY